MKTLMLLMLSWTVPLPAQLEPTPEQPCDTTLPASDYVARGNDDLHYADYEEALADFTCALQLDPGSTDAYLQRAFAYFNLGQGDLALADYTRVLELDPASTYALFWRAMVYRSIGQYDLALADYARMVELEPDNQLIYRARAKTYEAMGDLPKAVDDLSRAIELDPTITEYYLDRAQIHLAAGNDDLAIVDYTRAIEMRPESFLAYAERARTYFEHGDYDLAVADYTRVIELIPDASLYRVERGNVYFARGDYRRALADFKAGLALNSHDADAYAGIGRIFDAQGRTAEAFVYYRLHLNVTRSGDPEIAARAAELEPLVGVDCAVSPIGSSVRLRSGPGKGYEQLASLETGHSTTAAAQTSGSDGFTWYWLVDTTWVRADVVREHGDCEHLPLVTAP